jgi:hypothetical protein
MNPLLQLRRPLGSFTQAGPHPSRGGNPYSDDFRYDVITRFQLGLPLESPELNLLRAQNPPAYPSSLTCERIIQQFQTEGHFQPKEATGNHEAERKVLGEALPRLALYRRLFPEATIDHVRAWLFNMDPTIAPYSTFAIVEAEHLLGLRNKRSSTTCDRAFWPINLHKRELFWTANYLLGRANVSTRDMIDIDECGMKIEATNPRFGKCVSWERCWIEGAYNRDRKLNLLMAISADPQLNMEWHDIWPQGEGGTTVFRYYVFLERIIAWLAEHWPGRSFCFTADNLNVHHDENIIDLITSNGHRYLFRAPYWAVDGPMEYIFNTLHVHLLVYYGEVNDLDELEGILDTIIANMDGFIRYFLHCNFPNN